ncbi:helix-turn-helix domain-containing protein [Halostella sp. PRR32]|uniref:helix-turn-helix domain-containing protein n=1 Tax=Halostella sp. PRR32 TaxID=3098147 RepID=UPI002B1E0806|nr:helix-turn-helix domain-containing protein [Halostella sp. PRR32]
MTTTSSNYDKDPDLRDEYSFDHPWPWQVADIMRDLADDDLTPAEMASAMGCHPNTIYRYLDRHGIGLNEVGA